MLRMESSIRNRLLFFFFALLLLPVLTLGLIGPTVYSRTMEEQIVAHTLRMIAQVDKNLEYLIVYIEKLSRLLETLPEIQAFFMGTPEGMSGESPGVTPEGMSGESPGVTPEGSAGSEKSGGTSSYRGPSFLGGATRAEERALLYMEDFRKTHREIAGIMLIAADDRILTSHYARINRDPLTLENWYLKGANSTRGIAIIPRPIGRNIRSLFGFGADDVVSLVRPVWDPRSPRHLLGVILIDIQLEYIQELLADSSLGRDGYLYISDQNGELVFAPLTTSVYRIAPRKLEGDSGRLFRRFGQEEFQILFKRSSYTGWVTAGVFSMQSALREVSLIKWFVVVVGSITIFLAIILSLFFSASIARPIEQLRSLMKQVETGDFSIRFTGAQHDEIWQLGHSFNKMIEEIHHLIQQVYEEQRLKREIELRVLQEQIKPHFLYNTLDTIQWMAQEKGATDIVHMVSALTRLFRVGLSRGDEMVRLSEEIRHLESYLYIQKIRYEDKFDYSIEIQEGLDNYRVLKVILQPLVENAIYHGIKERRGRGHISISVRLEGADLLFIVEDDGIGIPEERLRQLEEELEGTPRTAHEGAVGAFSPMGFGARNVHERIRLAYGEPYGLRFSSMYGKGTVVTVRHPAVEG
ncbi:MAG: sensor histidine kinase [Breznakiellaceae bacterium]